MNQGKRITLFDLLCYLRESLIEAREKKDDVLLDEIKTTFTILREASYKGEDRQFSGLVTTFEDSAREAIMHVPWKCDVPSVEEIRSALSDRA